MLDLGYRSIEIQVVNYTQADLIIQSPAIGTGCMWISGETPRQGNVLSQYQSAVYGAYTNDINSAASFSFQLIGLGNQPVSITAQNNTNDQSAVTVTANNIIRGIVVQINTGEANHSTFNVQLVPVS